MTPSSETRIFCLLGQLWDCKNSGFLFFFFNRNFCFCLHSSKLSDCSFIISFYSKCILQLVNRKGPGAWRGMWENLLTKVLSTTREIGSSGVPHVFESALAVPWAGLTHSSWAKLMLAEALPLNCTWMSFLDGLLQCSGCVQVNSNFSQTRWQHHEGREAFRIMRAKINLYTQPAGCLSGSPAEQEYCLFSYRLEDTNTI